MNFAICDPLWSEHFLSQHFFLRKNFQLLDLNVLMCFWFLLFVNCQVAKVLDLLITNLWVILQIVHVWNRIHLLLFSFKVNLSFRKQITIYNIFRQQVVIWKSENGFMRARRGCHPCHFFCNCRLNKNWRWVVHDLW